jgi:trk system potassium uptake protein TrkH
VIDRFAAVFYILGILIVGFGVLMLVPLSISWLTGDGAHSAYDEAVLVTVATGVLLAVSVRGRKREMRVRESFLLVALIWSLLPAFGALPLYLHIPGLSWTDAYFEAVSGLTATGATVLSGLEQLPVSINFWRHSCTGLAASASSFSRSPSCRCWASAGAACSRPKRRVR